MQHRLISALLGLGLICCTLPAHASVTLNTTRVVFDGKHKEASLEAHNRGNSEILLQTWLDTGGTAANEGAPLVFAATPPLSKVGAGGRQSLRILYQGSGMPTDRESVLWLNVQEIPQASAKENVLQLAVRQRIKVFYRPAGLPGKANDAPGLLRWQLFDSGSAVVLRAENPSVYHISMATLDLTGAGYSSAMEGTTMLAPGETRHIAIRPVNQNASLSLRFNSINDYGGQTAYQAALTPGAPVAGTKVEATAP